MHILVTNDDGPPSPTSSPYIHSLITILQGAGHTVSVILPHIQRSWIGKAHFVGQTITTSYYRPGLDPNAPGEGSVTSDVPFTSTTTTTTSSSTSSEPAQKEEREEWILATGTPATCVQLGLHHFFTHHGPVDLVLSGPNYGRNTTTLFALSSGTLGGAMEGAAFGVRAVALSYAFFSREHDWATVDEAGRRGVGVVEWLCGKEGKGEGGNWGGDVGVYSVNVPLVQGVEGRGVWVTRCLENRWRSGSAFVEVEEEDGREKGERKGDELKEWKGEKEKEKEGEGAAVREKVIREQKDVEREEKEGLEKEGEGKKGVRSFKWAPKFADVHKSVDESEPGNDGWAIRQGFTSITPLRASFTEAKAHKFGEIKMTSSVPSLSSLSLSDNHPAIPPSSLRFYVHLPNWDPYLHPYLLSALASVFNPQSYCLLPHAPNPLYLHPTKTALLSLLPYESLDHTLLLSSPATHYGNAYTIRKAVIRKHYLAHTVRSFVTKHPDSLLASHVPETVSFELDYAEFLDEALMESDGGMVLKGIWEKNQRLREEGREGEVEWWILKPGMSDRGNGIRVFESEERLREIFEGWEEDEDEEQAEEDAGNEDAADDNGEDGLTGDSQHHQSHSPPSNPLETSKKDEGLQASALRHFIAQPYLPPLLLPSSPFPNPNLSIPSNRKFHIRSYVLSLGALKVYVYEHMLALFAPSPYAPPSASLKAGLDPNAPTELTARGLSNTCLQTPTSASDGEESGTSGARRVDSSSVHLLSSLPSTPVPTSPSPSQTREPWSPSKSTRQIHTLTRDLFAAAASQPTSFQPLPNAFEVFGLDWLVDEQGETWLLEVNAFPDFGMTGDKLGEKVVGGLWRGVLGVVGRRWWGGEVLRSKERGGRERMEDRERKVGKEGEEREGKDGEPVDVGWGMWRVLDLDMGRG